MPISYSKRSIAKGTDMSYQPNGYPPGPSELELRQRAAMRVARRRAFMTSLAITGSLAVLDLYLYSQSHDKVWLLLAVVFIGIVAYRAWVAFGGSDHADSRRIQQEMARMRQASPPAQQAWQSTANWQPPLAPTTQVTPSTPAPPVPPPPPSQTPPPPPADAAGWR
jgi:hypothetical protein